MANYGLALHTSSPELGLAIGDFTDNIYRSRSWPLGRETSNVLHSYLAEFMGTQTWADLAGVAVAIGPGGFTGTRLAVVTARTLGEQLQIPVFGISSLAAIAWSQNTNGIVSVTMPAQRGQIHAGLYEIDHERQQLSALQADQVTTLAEWDLLVTAGDVSRVAIEAGANVGYTVNAVWELARLQWEQGDRPAWSRALPVYGQSPVQ